MKKNKKVKTAVILAAAVTGVAGGGVAGVNSIRKNNSKTVEVTSVASLATDMSYMSSDDGTSGTVVSNVSQNVQVPEGKVIDKVYVSEGDSVKIGDKLLSYDTTLLELDRELQEITVMELGLEIKAAEADLNKLQNTRPGDPIPDSNGDTQSGADLSDPAANAPDVSSPDDGSDEEAKLIGKERTLLASQEDASVSESADSPETEPAQTENTDASVDENEAESSQESEVIIDQSESNTGEVLSPSDLDQPGNAANENGAASSANAANPEKPQQNQSLEKFFTNIRVKAIEEGEPLLADIRPGEQTQIEVNGSIRVVPHFAESGESHFRNLDTYTMQVQGVKLEKTIEGKVYGTAQINGEDYPEIGGYTLAQKSGSEDTAQLTIAFHDGLEKQHEKMPELEDMYLELTLDADMLTGDAMIFHTADNEKDAVVKVQKTAPQTEPETEPETEEPETDSELSTEETSEPETEEQGIEEQSLAEEEIQEETKAEDAFPIQTMHFTINWEHGTNARENWPSSMKAYFYKKGVTQQEDADATFNLTEGSSAVVNTDTGVDGTDTTIDEEVTTEPVTEAQSENESDQMTEREEETEEATEEATDITEVITDDDNLSSSVTWKTIDLDLPQNLSIQSTDLDDASWANLKEHWNEQWSGYAENYFMEIQNIQTNAEDASATVVINMTYKQPEDTPYLRLNPISELTYQHGINTIEGSGMRAYKGSGTAEDPYVFFVTDGVKITNTFVNWALGFNQEGTERKGEGYYIRLEIRESDTITGAFIRSIDLDGTIMADHGYGPGTYWIFNSETGMTRYEEEIADDSDNPDGGGGGWSNDNDGSTYTAEELAQAIEEKKLEVQKLKLDERQAKLKLKSYNKQLEESTVVSAVDGYVKSVNGSGDTNAYMVVESKNGMYVKTTVSELNLDDVAVDQVISCESWYTGEQFTATITEVDTFPSSESNSDAYFGSTGNVNSSSYPVLAVVDEAAEDSLSEYEDVSVKYPTTSSVNSGSIYLEKAYIRSENGQSYVYIADDNNKLKKQYVRTGGTLYGYMEIKQGLSTEDQIAFPYGKAVKEGAAVKRSEEE